MGQIGPAIFALLLAGVAFFGSYAGMASWEARQRDAEIQHLATYDRIMCRCDSDKTVEVAHREHDWSGPEAWLVYVTVPLMLFTGLLFLWTRILVLKGEVSSERQLRAYPGIIGGGIAIDKNIIRVWIDIKNYSPTPAYKFKQAFVHQYCDPGATEGFKEPIPRDYIWDMVPHSHSTLHAEEEINDGQIVSLAQGRVEVIFSGRVEYETFGKSRHIEFRYRNGSWTIEKTVNGRPVKMRSSWPEPVHFSSD